MMLGRTGSFAKLTDPSSRMRRAGGAKKEPLGSAGETFEKESERPALVAIASQSRMARLQVVDQPDASLAF